MKNAALALLLAASCACVAQDQLPAAPEPQSTPPAQSSGQQPIPTLSQKIGSEKHRIIHIVPAFDVAEPNGPYQPLSAHEKFRLMTDRVVDRFTVVKSVFGAALGQATDTPHYGQGWDAYGARVGAAAGDSAFHDFFAKAFFPAVLKQDPRYFQLRRGSGGERLLYAMSRVLVTKQDSGGEMPNFSQWLGTLAAAGLSNAYYPESDRTTSRTMTRAGTSMATEMGLNVVKEFWPEIKAKLKKKKKK